LDQCAHSHKEFLGLLKELVSGLLDLDRLDHYARDSYFSGLRQVSINVRGFLNNLCLTYVDNEENGDKKAHFWLTRVGGFYAASLLFGKRQIISTMFRNPRTVAFHTMANWSLSAYLEDLSDPSTRSKECLRIAMMEDDQFLEMIVGAAHEGCRYVGQRIRAMQPYICVGKLANTEITVNKKSLRRDLDEYTISQGENGSPKVILHYDDGFWELGRAKDSTDWLDTGFLLLEDTKKPLTDHPDHRDNFLPLRDADKIKYLWVFARDKEDVEKIKRDIRDICGGTAQCVS
jgi:HD superfamily phosphohydrolase